MAEPLKVGGSKSYLNIQPVPRCKHATSRL